jgi:cell division protein FtsB
MFGPDGLIVLFGVVIVFLLYLVFIGQRTINRLLDDVDKLSGQMQTTSDEIEALVRNVDGHRKKSL